MASTNIIFAGPISSIITSDSITANVVDLAGRSGKLNFADYKEIMFSVNMLVLTGTAPTMQVLISIGDEELAGAQQWFNLNGAQGAIAQGTAYMDAAGPGTPHNFSLGRQGRITWNAGGTVTACTFFVTIIGKM